MIEQLKGRKQGDYEVKVCFRKYSDKLLGYRIIIGGEYIFCLNENFDKKITTDAFHRLAKSSEIYADKGFIMLLSNYELYVSPHYVFKKEGFGFEFYENEEGSNVINLNQTVIALKRNIKQIKKIKRRLNITS